MPSTLFSQDIESVQCVCQAKNHTPFNMTTKNEKIALKRPCLLIRKDTALMTLASSGITLSPECQCKGWLLGLKGMAGVIQTSFGKYQYQYLHLLGPQFPPLCPLSHHSEGPL